MIQVYSLEEVATEKTVALADRARNEPRDLYDLWHLTSSQGMIQLDHLTDAIREKLKFRNKTCEGIEAAILQKEARLKLSGLAISLPDDHAAAVQRSIPRHAPHAASSKVAL